MRILHVIEPSVGGSPKHVRDLTRAFISRGHDVDAIVAPRDVLAEALRDLGAGVATVDFRPEITATRADLRALRSLACVLPRRRWDVVHTHDSKAGVLARPLAHRLGLPVVHSPHCFAYLTQRYRPRFAMEARRALTLGIERLLARCADVIVCVCLAERDAAIRDGIADPDRIAVVPYGIEPPAPVSPDPGLVAWRGEGPLVGFLARLHEQKAPLLFVEAVALMRRAGVRFKAALVGDGPLRDAVRRRVAKEGMQGDVAVLPFEGGAPRALAAFDLYVLPSLWEALPIAALEAMAASLPIVAADVGGVREAVLHERTGLLVPPGDVQALAAAIERLVGDAELRRRFGEAGRAHGEANFQMSAMVAGIEAAYERARARRGVRCPDRR